MTTYYNINPKFYVSVDCIIFGFDEGELKLLLLKRNFEPAMGKWSLMGGFVQEDESVDAAAKRVLAELTGLENVYMEQVGTFGDLERDPGERVISVAYYALVNVNEYDRELVQQHNAQAQIPVNFGGIRIGPPNQGDMTIMDQEAIGLPI